MRTLLSAADHWESVADDELARAAIDRELGIFIGMNHPGEHNSKLYREVAKALRLQDQTGEPHCLCHMTPRKACPFAVDGQRIRAR
jgi:hypothetical protein